jgi:hypothetical protein|tara:strand:+ start:536 stop:760 length:225 start_codon:yes stop_codon:yes gene_type:complete
MSKNVYIVLMSSTYGEEVFLYDEKPSHEYLEKLEEHYKKELGLDEINLDFMYERSVIKPIIDEIEDDTFARALS